MMALSGLQEIHKRLHLIDHERGGGGAQVVYQVACTIHPSHFMLHEHTNLVYGLNYVFYAANYGS